MAYPALQKISPEEYLDAERASAEKHQYFDGDVVAMSGASIPHNRIVGNIIGKIHGFLKNKNCEIFPSDLRVSVPEMNTYTYPDATIIYGEPAVTDEKKDTVFKRIYFNRQSTQAAIIYRRKENGHWDVSVEDNTSGNLTIESIGFTIAFDEVYRNVSFSG